jgi:hypothetical protein
MTILLYDKVKEKIREYKENDVMDELYYLRARLPTNKEIKDNILTQIKKDISKVYNKLPLYNIYSDNLYLINDINVYNRVVYNNYRFPSKEYIEITKKKYKELEKNIDNYSGDVLILKKRKLKKYKVSIEFMENFDLEELYKTYIKVFYEYSPEVGKKITLCEKPSFATYFKHITPYYTKNEIINLSLNMGLKKTNDLDELCKKVRINDLSHKILLKHHNYIIESKKVGLIFYYTIHGSYYINQYLRSNKNQNNIYLDKIINEMCQLISDAPAFDKDYILYRFIFNDNHLQNLEIGDIFMDEGFTSTTRDPFYNNEEQKFGYILIKIKIPKNIKGIGLCIETLSFFPNEQEIILPPKTLLRLDKKDEDFEYYHTNQEFKKKVITKYEFTLIEPGKLVIPAKKIIESIQTINFFNLDKTNGDLNDIISNFNNNYVNENKQVNIQIGDKIFTSICEYYDGTKVYSPFYALKISNGYSIYCFHENNILFFMEIGLNNNYPELHVDFYVRFSPSNRRDIITDEEYLNFMASVGNYFGIPYSIIYAEYLSCDKYQEINKKYINNKRIIQDGGVEILGDVNKEEYGNILGGNYCLDFIDYLKSNKKRYEDVKVLNMELKPKFDYLLLNKLEKIDPFKILDGEDKDEIYIIYNKIYRTEQPKNKLNIKDFYIWLIDNKCYLADTFEKKMVRFYGKDNPFEYSYYILNNTQYLYNRNLIGYLPKYFSNYAINIRRFNIDADRYRI